MLCMGFRLTGATAPRVGLSLVPRGVAAWLRGSGLSLGGGLPFQLLSLLSQRLAKLPEACMIGGGKAGCQSKRAIRLVPEKGGFFEKGWVLFHERPPTKRRTGRQSCLSSRP